MVLVLVLATAPAGAAPSLSRSPTRVLGIALVLPDGMTVVPNERDSDNVVLPVGVMRRAQLIFGNGALFAVARQTFMHLAGDFRRAVIAELKLQDIAAVTRVIELADGTKAVLVDPPAPRRGDQQDLLHAIYIADDTGRVHSISFYGSGAAYDDIDSWIQLAQQSTATAKLDGSWAWTYWTPVSITIASFTLEVSPPIDWNAVPAGPSTVMIYQSGPLGTPAAVCGIDDVPGVAPAGATGTQVKFLGVTGTARTWKAGTKGRAELVTPRGIRAWCHVRGGQLDDALRALRTLASSTKP